MPSDSRTHASNQEALLLDQALDAVNQRLNTLRQPLAIAHKAPQARHGLVQALSRARDRGVDFNAEYQRLSGEAFDALGAQPVSPVEPPASAARTPDPPPNARQQPAAASVPDNGVETTRLFLDFLEKRERQLFDLVHTVVTRNQPAAYPPPQQPDSQLDRLGTAMADLTRVLHASQPKFPRSVS